MLQKGSANSVKHAEAGGKEIASNDESKVKDARSMRAEGAQEIAGSLEKKSSGEFASCSQKSAATSTQKSAVVTKQTTLPAPPQNRFKLDNRTTSFRILPPLPPEIANVSFTSNHLPFLDILKPLKMALLSRDFICAVQCFPLSKLVIDLYMELWIVTAYCLNFLTELLSPLPSQN